MHQLCCYLPQPSLVSLDFIYFMQLLGNWGWIISSSVSTIHLESLWFCTKADINIVRLYCNQHEYKPLLLVLWLIVRLVDPTYEQLPVTREKWVLLTIVWGKTALKCYNPIGFKLTIKRRHCLTNLRWAGINKKPDNWRKLLAISAWPKTIHMKPYFSNKNTA